MIDVFGNPLQTVANKDETIQPTTMADKVRNLTGLYGHAVEFEPIDVRQASDGQSYAVWRGTCAQCDGSVDIDLYGWTGVLPSASCALIASYRDHSLE